MIGAFLLKRVSALLSNSNIRDVILNDSQRVTLNKLNQSKKTFESNALAT